jgi:hypothetical protein
MQMGEIKKEKCKYISQLIVAAKMELYSTKKCCASRIYTDKSELLFLYFFKVPSGSQFLKLCLRVRSQVNR